MGAEDVEEIPQPPPEVEYVIPSWAGKAAPGLHLDVLKGEKGLIQKLMIDEKRAYYFGRNPAQCDFTVDHGSASRVHAVLLYHAHLGRPFLVDLGSTHGTFVASVRLEARKPQQILPGQAFHFGASTRSYVLREKPDVGAAGDRPRTGLPAKEEELENLTEYNTALNRRIAALVPVDEAPAAPRKRKRMSVVFCDEEDVINPEDIDPTVGRFRNLVATTVIKKRGPGADHFDLGELGSMGKAPAARRTSEGGRQRSQEEEPSEPGLGSLPGFASASLKLGLSLPNPAPELGPSDLYASIPRPASALLPLAKRRKPEAPLPSADATDLGPSKKKYAKEAWPGRNKPGHNF